MDNCHVWIMTTEGSVKVQRSIKSINICVYSSIENKPTFLLPDQLILSCLKHDRSTVMAMAVFGGEEAFRLHLYA